MQTSSTLKRASSVLVSILLTAGLFLVETFDAGYNAMARGFETVGPNGNSQFTTVGTLCMIAVLAVAIYAGTQLRAHPRRVLWATLAVAIVTQMCLPLLCIAGATVLARQRERSDALWAAAAGALATLLVFFDSLRPSSPSALAVFLGDDALGQAADISAITSITVGMLAIIVSAATGLAMRFATTAKLRKAQSDRASEAVGGLQQKVARQQEHELLAREAHDGLASQLSMLSLQQEELRAVLRRVVPPESMASANEVVGRSQATLVKAHKDLSDLISLLREPGALAERLSQGGGVNRDRIAGVAELVAQLDRSGTIVSSNIVIAGAESMSPILQAGVYRIVQEAITNCTKHAPGRPVSITVNATAESGVTLRIANQVDASVPASAVPSGRGLIGIQERVHLLSGTSSIGLDVHGRFVVEARLPWMSAATAAA
ncbi:hypothetical protein JT358_16440 [Micrococcales bacterium 31B]|nr:hypothetical protein [Micrococcales bacterium 31B]